MMTDKILVTGGKGLLGTAIGRVLADQSSMVLARPDCDEMDITIPDQVHAFFRQFAPRVVIHCAAYTRVDDCETNAELADRVNGEGAGIVAKAAADHGAKFIHLSTDYIFDGESTSPYQPDDAPGEPNHLSAYGRSKLLGERRVRAANPDALMVRTAWVYGPDGPCFPKTILKLARDNPELRVVNDQTGSPTYTLDLARALLRLAETDARGIVHVTNSGACTWYELAREVVQMAGLRAPVIPVTTAEFPRPARRPKYSVLDNSRYVQLTGAPMRHWRAAVADYIREFESR